MPEGGAHLLHVLLVVGVSSRSARVVSAGGALGVSTDADSAVEVGAEASRAGDCEGEKSAREEGDEGKLDEQTRQTPTSHPTPAAWGMRVQSAPSPVDEHPPQESMETWVSTHSSEGEGIEVSDGASRGRTRQLTSSGSSHDTREVIVRLGEVVRSSGLEGTVGEQRSARVRRRCETRRSTHAAPAMGQAVSSLEGQRVGFWCLAFLTRARWRTGSAMQSPSLNDHFSGQAVTLQTELVHTPVAPAGRKLQGRSRAPQ